MCVCVACVCVCSMCMCVCVCVCVCVCSMCVFPTPVQNAKPGQQGTSVLRTRVPKLRRQLKFSAKQLKFSFVVLGVAKVVELKFKPALSCNRPQSIWECTSFSFLMITSKFVRFYIIKLLSSVCNTWTPVLEVRQSDIFRVTLAFICVPLQFLHLFIYLVLTTAIPS